MRAKCEIVIWTAICQLQDDHATGAIEKINSLLENFLGINDNELCKCKWLWTKTILVILFITTWCGHSSVILFILKCHCVISVSDLGLGSGEAKHDGICRSRGRVRPRELRLHWRLHLRVVGRNHWRQERQVKKINKILTPVAIIGQILETNPTCYGLLD